MIIVHITTINTSLYQQSNTHSAPKQTLHHNMVVIHGTVSLASFSHTFQISLRRKAAQLGISRNLQPFCQSKAHLLINASRRITHGSMTRDPLHLTKSLWSQGPLLVNNDWWLWVVLLGSCSAAEVRRCDTLPPETFLGCHEL